MIQFKINSKNYFHPTGWEELTLRNATRIASVKMPERLSRLYAAMRDGDQKRIDTATADMTDLEYIKEFPRYYGDVLTMICNIPAKDMERVSADDRRAFFDRYTSKFLLGIFVHPFDFEAKPIDSFTYEGQEYHLPETIQAFGTEIPGANMQVIEFTEAADLQLAQRGLMKGQIENAANVIAILCRPKGEVYDETKSLDRAIKFMDLSMATVFEVFFSLLELLTLSLQNVLISSLEEEVREGKTLPQIGAGKEKFTGLLNHHWR